MDIETTSPVSEEVTENSPETTSESAAPSIYELDKVEKFKFQGQEWTPKDLEKAILRQKDYTQKTQSLSEERKSFDQERKYYDNLYYDLLYIKNNPEQQNQLIQQFISIYPQKFHAALKQALNESTGQAQARAENHQNQKQSQGPDVELMSRLNNLEKFYHDQEIAKNKSQVDSIVTSMSSKYPDALPELVVGRVWEAYNQILEQDPNAKLTEAMWEDTFKSVDKEMKDMVNKKYGDLIKKQSTANEKAKSPAAGGGTPGRAPAKFKSLKEVREFAISDLTKNS